MLDSFELRAAVASVQSERVFDVATTTSTSSSAFLTALKLAT